MDEQLKARLIGAAILVLITVLLVPELLSGRKASDPAAEGAATEPGTRSFTIDLDAGGQASLAGGEGEALSSGEPKAAEPSSVSTTRRAPEPEPASSGDAEATEAKRAEPAARQEPAARPVEPAAPEPKTQSASEPSPVTGGWAVQVGAFGSEKSARKLASQLSAEGFDTFVAPTTRGGKTLHRVRVGPLPDRASADRLAERIKARKLPAAVVAND